MKNRLISFWSLGRLVDRAKDRAGKYSLRKVNQFPKVGPVVRPPAVVANAPTPVTPPAPTHLPPEWVASSPRPTVVPGSGAGEMVGQSGLETGAANFSSGISSGEPSSNKKTSSPRPSPPQSCGEEGGGVEDGSEVQTVNSISGISLPDPLLEQATEERDQKRASERGADARPTLAGEASPQPSLFDAPVAKGASAQAKPGWNWLGWWRRKSRKGGFGAVSEKERMAADCHPPLRMETAVAPAPKIERDLKAVFIPENPWAWLGNVRGFFQGAVALVPRTLGRLRGNARVSDFQPRAQAELALEKVTVLRNDLSDVDVEVVLQRKADAAKASASPSVPNKGGTGTSWWAKTKSPFAAEKKEGSPATVAVAAQKRETRPTEMAEGPS